MICRFYLALVWKKKIMRILNNDWQYVFFLMRETLKKAEAWLHFYWVSQSSFFLHPRHSCTSLLLPRQRDSASPQGFTSPWDSVISLPLFNFSLNVLHWHQSWIILAKTQKPLSLLLSLPSILYSGLNFQIFSLFPQVQMGSDRGVGGALKTPLSLLHTFRNMHVKISQAYSVLCVTLSFSVSMCIQVSESDLQRSNSCAVCALQSGPTSPPRQAEGNLHFLNPDSTATKFLFQLPICRVDPSSSSWLLCWIYRHLGWHLSYSSWGRGEGRN